MNGRYRLLELYATNPELPWMLDGAVLEAVDGPMAGFPLNFPARFLPNDDRTISYMAGRNDPDNPEKDAPFMEYDIKIDLVPLDTPYVSPAPRFTDEEQADMERQMRENWRQFP